MGAQEKPHTAKNSMQRVKVYRLNDDGKWDDQGTGHVTVDYLERSEELGLFVIGEEDNETLLFHRISSDDIYRKQEDTIISWRDPEYSTELALSFQETTGCSYIWDHICSVQRNMHFNTLNGDTGNTVSCELRELPAIELSTLPLILKTVVESGIADQMRVTELILHDQDFFRKLMDLFRVCEDLENIDGLHAIFKIVRGIILLNNPQIYEKIFGDELIMDIIGSLEYDPDVSLVQHHRSFLKEHVVFKEAIPIKEPTVLSKIHQAYRVGYLKDVIFPRALDDTTLANLNSIIHSNNATVVSLLKDDCTFIQELFARLRSSTTSAESKKDLVLFLHEFCSLSKSLQIVQHHRLFRDLVNEGIFEIIDDVLVNQDKKLVLIGTDILILFLNQDPNLLRSYVTRQEGTPLLGLLVKGMITDFGDDMNCQFLQILRSLLDSYTTGSQRDTVIEIFYEKHLDQLIDVITSSCPPNNIGQSVSTSVGTNESTENKIFAKPEILLNICELLCFCVIHHPYKIKCNFLLNNMIDKVLSLTRRREKYLVVAAVRFLRTLISRNDEHLMNHIVKNNLLKPIVEAFVFNGSRYNLLNSVVLELFHYIRTENLMVLLKYIIDSFWNQLVNFENLTVIHFLKVRYDQSLENSGTKDTINVSDTRKRIDERALEKEEEDYFNEDSDEEDSASASMSHSVSVQAQPVLSNGCAASYQSLRSKSGGLVDYDYDEDDEGYKPPPRKQAEISDEDEGIVESLRLKRKLGPKEEPEPIKKQRIGKNSKSKNSVFAALCSTLSQAVLPNKKTESTMHIVPSSPNSKNSSIEENRPDNGSTRCPDKCTSSDEANHKDKESADPRNGSDSLHNNSDNRQLSGEDCSLIPPNITRNGS
ncbi:Serine/threonine-protein phosphatase 4 regulatory subunit like [Actinidia chinensis var. chinensis]|uniref:Serine/threonine-protein phosphatase 4 regulatory subunit like n=1 Tax=Actinidia chinensis var. chinensis TaxID=1590841 RepID=A0A2R6PVU1_ACTCC|nr:Serine/threonine-protein phosphatase 4 regulatory subunit like [Actinidia chinensis var. chinensis]